MTWQDYAADLERNLEHLRTEPLDLADIRAEQAAVRDLETRPALAEDAFVIGREAFTRISAVEGMQPSTVMKKRAEDFDRMNLTAAERRRAIIEAHRKAENVRSGR